ncbi:hypothetical protein HZS_1729 [Henneguya salminicola]|nr:hypothetical protein HZS_1729 [Henneguya salminicola]
MVLLGVERTPEMKFFLLNSSIQRRVLVPIQTRELWSGYKINNSPRIEPSHITKRGNYGQMGSIFILENFK